MSAADFHQILGVTPDASAAEIKRAYKRLAMRWHPDRNPDPQAHDQFRRVREAFERLTQPAEDEATDNAAEASPPHKPRQSRPRGPDHRQEVTVDLTEAARGTTVTVTIDGREPCDDCDGSGHPPRCKRPRSIWCAERRRRCSSRAECARQRSPRRLGAVENQAQRLGGL